MTDRSNDDGPEPRYKWIHHLPELDKEDFLAILPNGDYFGRISKSHSHPERLWLWSVQEPVWMRGDRGPALPLSGHRKSARWAAAAVEEGFERVALAKGFDIQKVMAALAEPGAAERFKPRRWT